MSRDWRDTLSLKENLTMSGCDVCKNQDPLGCNIASDPTRYCLPKRSKTQNLPRTKKGAPTNGDNR